MNYKAPFYAVSKSLYGALSTSNLGLQWFDQSVPVDEIEAQFKSQAQFAYGIMGPSRADCDSNKDTKVWRCSLDLEIYSNYRGRKDISQKLEGLLNYLSSDAGWQALQTKFIIEHFQMISVEVGGLVINPPVYADIGVWQSGGSSVTFILEEV